MRREKSERALPLIGALRTIRSIAEMMPQSSTHAIGGDGFREVPSLWGTVYQEATEALRAYGYPLEANRPVSADLDEMIEALRAP